MVGPVAKREGVARLWAAMGLSERRAKMIRYRSCRSAETDLRARLHELANERRRFGYRRLFVLLRQEGEQSGKNRIYRLYREEGLTVRKRRVRRRWSWDFVHDQFANGRRLRILNIVDDVTCE